MKTIKIYNQSNTHVLLPWLRNQSIVRMTYDTIIAYFSILYNDIIERMIETIIPFSDGSHGVVQ